jgi:hypothetical protein
MNIAASPVNGINTGYFIGRSAKIIKYTPIATYVEDPTRIAYSINAEDGKTSDLCPKNLRMDSHAETGRNIPNMLSKHKIPAIQRQIFNPRIFTSFQLATFTIIEIYSSSSLQQNPHDPPWF